MQLDSTAFRSYTHAEAEAELVGACIDHEHALLTALRTLPLDDFRSEQTEELRRVFYVLAGWYSKGLWDRDTNRERLALYFDDYWIDNLWCDWGVVPEYVSALCNAIKGSNDLLDEAVAAHYRLKHTNPLRDHRQPPPPPVVVAAPSPPRRPQHPMRGGVA